MFECKYAYICLPALAFLVTNAANVIPSERAPLAICTGQQVRERSRRSSGDLWEIHRDPEREISASPCVSAPSSKMRDPKCSPPECAQSSNFPELMMNESGVGRSVRRLHDDDPDATTVVTTVICC